MTMKIGEIDEIECACYSNNFRWKIPNFFSLPKNADAFYESPSFEFVSSTWCLRLFPNGPKKSQPSGWIGLFLCKQKSEYRKHVLDFTLSILDVTEDDYICKEVNIHTFIGNDVDWGWFNFFERSKLLNSKSQIESLDKVTICCRTDIADEETTRRQAVSENPSTSDITGLGTKNMLCNIKDLFLKEKNCDVTIRVKDQEFRAHRLILEARCPVFAAMFAHDVKESRSGVVEITDADPEDFREILLYIYSGEVENFSTENVCQLYILADKYDLEDLQQECAILMENTLSVETVCDVIHIADKYGEIRMKNSATDFIAKNRCNVLATDKWKKLESENLLLSYETIKSIFLEE